jgi:hypothetical protein
MQKWEYQEIVSSRVQTGLGSVSGWKPPVDLRKFGNDGWELVAVVPIADWHAIGGGITDNLVYFFKRPRESKG